MEAADMDPAGLLQVALEQTFNQIATAEWLEIEHVYILCGLLGLNLIICLLSLFFRRGSFWLFRLQPTSGYSIIVPNSIILWTISSIITCILLIPFLTIKLENAFVYQALIFYPLWLGGWCMAVGTVSAPLLLKRDTTGLRIKLFPHFFNIFSISVSTLFLIALIPISYLGYSKNASLHNLFQQSSTSLVVNNFTMKKSMEMTEALRQAAFESVKRWELCWTIWTFFIGMDLLLFTVASIAYFHILNKSIKNVKSQQGRTIKLQSLITTYASLITTTSCTTTLMALYWVLSFCIATFTPEISASPNLSAAINLLPSYIFTVLGGSINIVICSRSYGISITEKALLSTTSHGSILPISHRLTPEELFNKDIIVTREWETKVDSEKPEVYEVHNLKNFHTQ